MPFGYNKRKDNSRKCEYCKTHNNGEETRVDIEKIPESDEWFAYIDDDMGTEELGRFTSKAEAKTAAKNWMKNNPKGLQNTIGGGVLPGAEDKGQWNGFF